MSDAAEAQNSSLPVPDAILEDIFLLLDAPADVVRASAACKSHRRVVCDSRFLRRYRFLHPPPVLGFVEFLWTGGFIHAELPHQSAPAARSLKQAADFTFSFLPKADDAEDYYRKWVVADARDGRVLLSRYTTDDSAKFMELVICDPLHRRYIEIQPIPEDLVPKRYSVEMESEAFLLPAREEEESQFQVIYNWVSKSKIITFLFDSGTAKWRLATSFSFLPEGLIHNPKDLMRHYVGNRFYWTHQHELNHMLVLDTVEMKFSIARLPFQTSMKGRVGGVAIVDAGLNGLGLIILDYAHNLNLYSNKAWQNNGGIAEEWQHNKHHRLLEVYQIYKIIGTAEGSLILAAHEPYMPQHDYFILDPKTLLVEKLCESKPGVLHAFLYARLPPSLSPPSI